MSRPGDQPARRWRSGRTFLTALTGAPLLLLAACGPSSVEPPPETEPSAPPPDSLVFQATHWDAMPGWADGDPRAALAAFQASCERWEARSDDALLHAAAPWAGTVGEWRAPCAAAAMTRDDDPAAARAGFEALFEPLRLIAAAENGEAMSETGLLTGYYEPFLNVRERPNRRFSQPLRARPDDLLTVNLGDFDPDLAGLRIVGRVEGDQLAPYAEREEIETEQLGEIFAWGEPIEVFFLQIQGSGRLVYPDGRMERAAFAAHNGRPYRSIGRELIARGELEAHAASKAGIEAWLELNGPEATEELFSVNPRYVFFRTEPLDNPDLGPRGAAGAPLTPMASLAVDPRFTPWGAPVWIRADLPEAEGWTGLMIAQDAGGAITGPLRGDFFWGWGEDAERRAGTTRARAEWTLLLPRRVAERLLAEQALSEPPA